MNQLRPALEAGIGIFGATTALVFVAFIYFLYSTGDVARQFSRREYNIKLARSYWVYGMSILVSFGSMILYLVQYYGQGFAVKPDLSIIVWLRWLFYAWFTDMLTHVLCDVMAHQSDNPDAKQQAGGDSQSYFCNRAARTSALFILAATLSQSRDVSAVWIASSAALFCFAVASLFFPRDKIWGRSYMAVRDIIYSEMSIWHVMTRSLPENQRENSIVVWSFIYRFILLLQWVLSYVGLIVTWCLSDGNSFSRVIGLELTVDLFLVFDVVFVVPLSLLFVFLTFKNLVKKVVIVDKRNGHVHFAARPTLQ